MKAACWNPRAVIDHVDVADSSWRSTSPTLRSCSRSDLGHDPIQVPDMGHHLFPLRSIQVSPVPMKGVPELAGPVLKSLQTLGLAVDGSGRSQPQHGEFANPPASHCRSSQNPVDGRDVPSDLRSLLRCTIRSVIGCRRRRLRQLSPNRQEYVRPGYHHLPSPETPLGTMLPPGKKCPRPSDQALSRQDASS